MKKFGRILLVLLLVAAAVYLSGPKPTKPVLDKEFPSILINTADADAFVNKKESEFNIRPDNEARIVWANDTLREKTEYCLLYLHGFSASWYEGYPANTAFAQYFGMNAYFPRLASHGIETDDALIDMTPDNLWNSAKEALAVARNLGDKVIIMSTSTGGTLGLQLAADFPEFVSGLILYSPNIRINNSAAFLLSKPWGLQIGRKAMAGNYRITNEDFDSKECLYWYCKYRMEAVVYLQQLVDATMKKTTYEKVKIPVLLAYYFKDEENQDQTVRVDAMLKMFEQLGTHSAEKIKTAFPEAGDHVIACELTSGSADDVLAETIKFGKNVLKLKAVR